MTATYTPLANTTLAATATQITFGSIPATYRDLILVVQGSVTVGGGSTRLLYNNSAANFSYVQMLGNGSTAVSNQATVNDFGGLSNTGQSSLIINIMDYSSTDTHKVTLGRANGGFVYGIVSRWANLNAITTVTLQQSTGSFTIGTTFSLYGVIS